MAIYSLDLPISSAVAVALGWTLLHALWQGFVLVLPAALLMHISRRKSSQLRYNIGVGALLAQVMLSMATFGWYYQPVGHAIHSSAKAVLIPVSAPAIWPVMSRTLPWPVQVQQFLEGHLTEIVLCWLIGVAVFLVRLAGGWLYVQRLKTTAVQPADQRWQAMQARLSGRLAVWQSVRVLESAQVLVPMVVGALKPVILLPVGLAAGLSMDETEAILAHELAHIKRFDYGVNLLQSVVEVMYFFHPALWWLSARVREERENCCDDLAVLACGNARSLAQALARVEEFGRTPALAMALASRKKLLLNRVRRMLGISARPVVSNGHLLALTLATVLLATASVYAIQDKKPQPKPRKPLSGTVKRQKIKTSGGTEFGITDKRKVEYVVWKGQKLPTGRVATLQRQLDQVMAGQLNLDDVQQSDRDILLAIFETGQVTGNEPNPVSPEAANSYRIAAEALAKVNMDSVMASVASIKYNKIVDEAFSSLSSAQPTLDSIIQPEITDVIRRQDSLADLRELNKGKVAILQAQAQSQGFAVEAVERKIERLERQKSLLDSKRFSETSSQQQVILKSRFTRTDSSRVALTKQMEASELAIQSTELAIEKINQQLIDIQGELEKARKPLRETETQIRKLNYSEYVGWHNYTGSDPATRFPRLPRVPKSPEIYEPTGRTINGSAVISPRTSRTSGWGSPPKPAWPAATTRPPAPAAAPRPAVAPVLKPVAKPAMPPAAPKAIVEPNN